MPLNLPIELLRQILVALGPCSLNPDDRQDATQRTLYRCCLASKALKAVAQPLLYQAVLLREERSVQKLASEWTYGKGFEMVQKVVAGMPNLRRLWMSGQYGASGYPCTGWDEFELSLLANLESLTMTATSLSGEPPSSFSNLVQLAFVDSYISADDLNAILHPDMTPNLGALHLNAVKDPDEEFERAYFPMIPSSSLRRLNILQLNDGRETPREPYSFEPNFQLGDIAVQFYTEDSAVDSGDSHHHKRSYCTSPGTQRLLIGILDLAVAHKIDIVWHDWDPRTSDSMVCEDFWRYVREKKAGTWRG
ncbi:hypothetical protein NBRC10513v2_007887 [Rhodotorula toruloides]